MCCLVFFFFQAEDGIRDKLVTGVQTCALPIWISSTAWGTMSVATTRAPALAARTAASPSPLPISSTRSPERTARCRQKNNDPAFGGWTPPATRNTEPRQLKRSSPASLPSKNLPEVEAKGFLELSARAGTRLRVLELIEVELERHALLLHPVELRRQPAPLVRFGEDELRPLERAVVLGDLLHGLDDDTLDLLGLRRRHRGERRRQANLRHRSTPSGCPRAPSPRSREWRS